MNSQLTIPQEEVITSSGTSFLLGVAGTGKTTALQQRLLHLLAEGETAYTILVMVAEPDRRESYLAALHQSGLGPYSELVITTYSSLMAIPSND